MKPLLSLFLTLCLTPLALASSDYDNAYISPMSAGETAAEVRFATQNIRAVINTVDPHPGESYQGCYDAMLAGGSQDPVVLGTNSDVACQQLAEHFFFRGGYYEADGDSDLAHQLAAWVDEYIDNGTSSVAGLTITETHNAYSFAVSCDHDLGNGTSQHYEVEKSYDGAVLPRCDLNHGRDQGPCQMNDCGKCAAQDKPHGMPVWGISQPYLNLWVRDTPVFYRTSLGREIGFTVSYKQRDTRPADDGLVPATGWSHNWYSYIHFCIPVTALQTDGTTNLDVIATSARGFLIRTNWVLTKEVNKWQAILYGLDNSESYFSAQNNTDVQNDYRLIPSYDTNGITGFRLVHSDGSQDLYNLVVGPQHTYGIVSRNGCVFDKADMGSGMAGVGKRGQTILLFTFCHAWSWRACESGDFHRPNRRSSARRWSSCRHHRYHRTGERVPSNSPLVHHRLQKGAGRCRSVARRAQPLLQAEARLVALTVECCDFFRHQSGGLRHQLGHGTAPRRP